MGPSSSKAQSLQSFTPLKLPGEEILSSKLLADVLSESLSGAGVAFPLLIPVLDSLLRGSL